MTTRMGSPADTSIPRNNRGCLRDAAIVGSVILALMLVVGIASSFIFLTTNNTAKQEDLATLTREEVTAALESLSIPTPDLSGYAYVPEQPLGHVSFESIEIGSIRYGSMKDGHMTPSSRLITAKATWSNDYVKVTRPITAEFDFASADDGWRIAIHTLGDVQVEPLRPLNPYDIEADIIPLLRLYDPALGETFAGARVQFESDLWKTGGTVKATLSKTVDGTPAECIVNLVVNWSNDHGWEVEIASVSTQSSASLSPADAESAVAPTPGEEEQAQTLDCHEGELVAVTGTLVQNDGVFVLKTATTTVHMSGRSWVVERFVVTGPSAQLTENAGKTVTVRGYITIGNALADAPLSVAMVSLS